MRGMARLFPINRLRRGIFAAGLCLALSACENPWLDDAPTLESILSKDWLEDTPSLNAILSKGWLYGDKDAAAAKTVQPVYCYETIGVGECYDQPLEDGGNRLIGFEGPAPAITPLPPKP
jgi:hypothetical protein